MTSILAVKGVSLSPHPSLRCRSVSTTARTPRTRGTSLAATSSPITPSWGRRACSGPGAWVRKAWDGRERAGTLAGTTPSASLSSASTSTGAQRGKSCPSWSATAWGTWASPPLDMVRMDGRTGAQNLPLPNVHVFSCLKVCVFLVWPLLVEDLTNLTASDVMNRVNLGYLQGELPSCGR